MKLPYRPLWFKPGYFKNIILAVIPLCILPILYFATKELFFKILSYWILTLAFSIVVLSFVLMRVNGKTDFQSIRIHKKGISRIHDFRFKAEQTFLWSDIAQVRFVRTFHEPGAARLYGAFYFARRELTEREWEAMTFPNADVMDVQVRTEEEYNEAIKLIGKYIEKDRLVLTREGSPAPEVVNEWMEKEIKEPVTLWAMSGKTFLSYGFIAPLTFIFYITVSLSYKEGIQGLAGLFGVACANAYMHKIYVFYRITSEGIKRYVFPGILKADVKWEDIDEAGFTSDRSVYITATALALREGGKKPKDSIVARSTGEHPKMAAVFAKHVPAEKWVR